MSQKKKEKTNTHIEKRKVSDTQMKPTDLICDMGLRLIKLCCAGGFTTSIDYRNS